MKHTQEVRAALIRNPEILSVSKSAYKVRKRRNRRCERRHLSFWESLARSDLILQTVPPLQTPVLGISDLIVNIDHVPNGRAQMFRCLLTWIARLVFLRLRRYFWSR
jgi:hypothetical protein